ncbi:MAG TPA: DUF1638 domain-containing protein [Rhodospirillales bacterium]|nr:DUF1638 domain-containing protein [Rhodospirillales bacterium]
MVQPADTLLIACGALAREITDLIDLNGWHHMAVQCLPAILHNTPGDIPERVRLLIADNRHRFAKILVVYGDCGTGGLLDAVIAEEGVERIAGPHCYEFYTGVEDFRTLSEAEPGTFYLTDYLVRQFRQLVIEGLGLDRYPQLMESYFGNYSRLLYLAQTEDPDLVEQARAAADQLGLTYEYKFTGMGGLADFIKTKGAKPHGEHDNRLLA